MRWFEKAEDELCDAVNSGDISEAEYRASMRDLHAEMREQAEMAAQEAYDREMGGW